MKNVKLDALMEMADMKGSSVPMKPHEATCPNCGYSWVMGEDDEDEADEDEY